MDVEKTEGLSFKNVAELSTFLMDMQGQMATMQEAIDKLAPVNEEATEEVTEETTEETTEATEEELSDLEKLLQE